jgi:hypothetical protein
MSAAFRGRTNVSARVALAVSPAIAAYAIAAENTMQKAQYNPGAYGIYPKGHVLEQKPQAVDHLKCECGVSAARARGERGSQWSMLQSPSCS